MWWKWIPKFGPFNKSPANGLKRRLLLDFIPLVCFLQVSRSTLNYTHIPPHPQPHTHPAPPSTTHTWDMFSYRPWVSLFAAHDSSFRWMLRYINHSTIKINKNIQQIRKCWILQRFVSKKWMVRAKLLQSTGSNSRIIKSNFCCLLQLTISCLPSMH